jgi:hypothetical protein
MAGILKHAICITGIALVPLVGCAPRETRIEIQSFRSGGEAELLFQEFDTCYYAMTAGGHMDIVMQRETPSQVDPAQTIAQAVHLRGFWKPIPGTTLAEESMINGTICYMIVTGTAAVGYQGGLFMSFRENVKLGRLTGKLESSRLEPLRKRGGAKEPFASALAKGTFVAERDRRRVVKILNDMERRLGPPPEYVPKEKPFVR